MILSTLTCRTKSIPGASIEHNTFCVSVHFRNCEADRLEEVVGAVEAVLAQDKELRATRGRKVLEVRPQVILLQHSPWLHKAQLQSFLPLRTVLPLALTSP